MKSNHTPGLWVARYYTNTNRCYVVAGETIIFEQWTNATETISPDAHLIAAAPEMLAALKYVAADDGCPPDVEAIIMRAINKAEGWE